MGVHKSCRSARTYIALGVVGGFTRSELDLVDHRSINQLKHADIGGTALAQGNEHLTDGIVAHLSSLRLQKEQQRF